MNVCLQAGHQNIQSNCWPAMRGGTGAHDEITWTPMIRGKIAALLRANNVDVLEVDANVNCPGQPHGPFDMFLALHYQSDPPHVSGYGVFVPDPSVDRDHARSVALANALRGVYGQRIGIPDRSAEWKNPNTDLYYVWQVMNGPLALIECGTGAPGAPDHDLLWGQPDRVASAITEGICAGLGVPFNAPAPGPSPDTGDDDMLYVGPFHPLAASLKAFTPGSSYLDPSSKARVAATLAAGATVAADGYRYSDSPVQSSDLGGGVAGPDYVWWHSGGTWVPDAILDTTALAGAPAAGLPATESLSNYFAVAGTVGPSPGPDDDSQYATKADLAAVANTIPTKGTGSVTVTLSK